MAIKFYMQATGIPGDATAGDYRNWIDVLSYSWGGDNAGGLDPLGDSLAPADAPLQVTCNVGKQTTGLLGKFHTRGSVNSVVLVGVDGRDEFIRITLSQAHVTQWEMAGSASSDSPAESWSFSYRNSTVRLGSLEESWSWQA